MKLFLDYKKQLVRLAIIIILITPLFFAGAQNAEQVRDRINERNAEIERLEAEINAYQSQLNSLDQEKSSLSNSIKELDLTRKKLNADISVTQNKIDKTNLTISSLSNQIGNKEESIANALFAIELGIREIYEIEEISMIEALLAEDDFTSVWNNIDSIISVRERMRNQIDYLSGEKIELEGTREKTLKAKQELANLKSDLSYQKRIVEENTKEKSRLLTQTKNNEKTYQILLDEKIAQKIAVEQELRSYESQLEYILDPSKLPSSRVFSWPVDKVYITQLFGKTSDSKRLYASGTHSGVDFRASVGTPVKAMADGVVAGVGDTDLQCRGASFGKFVFIKYDNGLASAFGHLSLIRATNGQRVTRGQVVAYSGNTGYSTGPHLHVTVYAPGAAEVRSIPSKSCTGKILTQPIAATSAYLDPMLYLPPYK